MTLSMNNRLILEVYQQTGVKSVNQHGLSMPGQRDGIKGLRILVGITLPDGRHVPAESIAYIREEFLYNVPWTKKIFKCDFLPEPFMVADLAHIDMIRTPDSAA